jgi:hypothetical protein
MDVHLQALPVFFRLNYRARHISVEHSHWAYPNIFDAPEAAFGVLKRVARIPHEYVGTYSAVAEIIRFFEEFHRLAEIVVLFYPSQN